MMSNADVQAMFDQYGERVCAISLNNGKLLYIGYRGKGSTLLSDISFETVGGCDMMVVSKTDISSGRDVRYKNYITTEFIESVVVMDEEFADYRVDPLLLK